MEKQIIEMLQKLTEKVDKIESKLDKLEEGQINLSKQLQDFRLETSQNFATLVNNDRNIRNEIQALDEKQDEDTSYLTLKSDVLQKEILRMKRT